MCIAYEGVERLHVLILQSNCFQENTCYSIHLGTRQSFQMQADGYTFVRCPGVVGLDFAARHGKQLSMDIEATECLESR